MAQTIIYFQKVHKNSKTPTRSSKYSAGYDLYSTEEITLEPKSRALIDTGIKIHLPHATYGRIAPRSGLALKHGIDVGGGVIDEDYRGTIGVILFNHSTDSCFHVKVGDRIAQIICETIIYPEFHEVSQLDDTDRGESGFGSSGN